MAWATPDQVRDRWADAPLDDGLLDAMLAACQEQVEAYAPALAVGSPVPARYTEALVLQVRALGQSMDRDGDVLGFGDGFAVRVRPLAADVKALLRPSRGVPALGGRRPAPAPAPAPGLIPDPENPGYWIIAPTTSPAPSLTPDPEHPGYYVTGD